MTSAKWERILAPTDLSPASQKAVAYAHALAEKFHADLHVLHVVKTVQELAKEHGVASIIEAGATDEPQQMLAEMLGESGTVRRVEAIRMAADAGEAIARYVRDEDIDLVVVATHGRTGLAHAMLGSVAEKLLRISPCPVLVLRH